MINQTNIFRRIFNSNNSNNSNRDPPIITIRHKDREESRLERLNMW